MISAVLLDTSFIITFVDSSRPNHEIAKQYYKLLVEKKIPIYFSTIVSSEFSIKNPVNSLPLNSFRIIPFNLRDSIESARIYNLLGPQENGVARVIVRNDLKIMAQAVREKIPFILTEDASTLVKYCSRLTASKEINVRTVLLADGFDNCAFNLDGQKGLDFSEKSANSLN